MHNDVRFSSAQPPAPSKRTFRANAMPYADVGILIALSNIILEREVRKMIRKLKSGEFRLYSQKKDPKTGKRKNLGTFNTRAAAEKHERAVQYFKRHG